MLIYMLRNKINGKLYIGQTVRDINERLREYRKAASRKNSRQAIYLAINKHGWSNFNAFVLDRASSQEELDALEQYWISHYNCVAPNGYNLTTGGRGNGHLSSETKQKISRSKKGCRPSPEAIAKGVASNTGRKASIETRRLMIKGRSDELGPLAKLTWQTVANIRERFANGEKTTHLACEFSINTKTLLSIIYGETWKVKGYEPPPKKSKSKLVAKQVEEIFKRKLGGETLNAVAKDFGVSEATISNIWNGKQWRSVTSLIEYEE
jgi:group I intron endonuclease